MKECASCGASYDEARAYCPECGVAADESLPELTSYDSQDRRESEPPDGDPGVRRHAIALLVAVALVVIGVVAYVVVRNPGDDDDNRTAPPPASTTTAPTTPETSDSPATTSNPPPPPNTKVGLVTMPTALTEQSRGRDVAELLNSYFTAINNRDFETWKSVLKPEGRDFKRHFKRQWKGLDSTHDRDVRLFHISGSGQSISADVSFTSTQDPEDGPRDGEDCTHWDMTYILINGPEGTLLIDRVDESRTTSRACPDS